MLNLIIASGPGARAKAPEFYNRITYRQDDGDIIDATVYGDTGEYRIWLNLKNQSSHCDCPSFQHRDGPCKHIAAVAAVTVADHEEGGPNFWIRAAVIDDRNSGRQFARWEFRPEPSEELAEQHNAKYWERYLAHVCVKGYLIDHKVWTGELPLPHTDDKILAYLPTGEQVPGVVQSVFEGDPTYIAYNVVLDWQPEGFDSTEVVLFGSEILQGSDL